MQEPEEIFFETIEQYFLKKRGNPMLLSPKEWSLIREWYEAGIPEAIVLRGIDTAFEKKKKSGEDKEVGSLLYCKGPVKKEYKLHLKSLEGAGPSAPASAFPASQPKDVRAYLEHLQQGLEGAVSNALSSKNEPLASFLQEQRDQFTVEVLQSFEKNPENLQRVEERLTNLEKQIEQVLLQTISEEQLVSIKEDAMRELKSFQDKLDLPVYQEMLRRAMIKSARKIYGIPRLSLFYM